MAQLSFDLNKQSTLFENSNLPILFYAGKISDEPEWHFPCHKHDDLSEIIFINEGEGTFIIDNKTFVAKKGDILIYNAGTIHEEFSNPRNPLKTYFCGVGNLYIKDVKKGSIIPSNILPVIHANDYISQIENFFKVIYQEVYQKKLGYNLICQNLLISIIALIHRIISDTNEQSLEKHNSLGRRIKKYIENNYNKNISLQNIADHLFISPNYASFIFKKEMSYPPMKYLTLCRIGEAKRLLLTTDLKINEISKVIGYDNPNYFTMVFKDIIGDSPSQFRKYNKKTSVTYGSKLIINSTFSE